MLFSIAAPARSTRLAVLAYDIASARRARRTRRVLEALHHAKQYSVFEAMLGEGQLHGVLAEISEILDFAEDRLAVWRPSGGVRLSSAKGRLIVCARQGQPCSEPADVPHNTGNFIVCYDITDPGRLGTVAAEVAPEAALIQRSVYWLRGNVGQLAALFARCAPSPVGRDVLWAYPLRGSRDLWRVESRDSSILPITSHRWGRP